MGLLTALKRRKAKNAIKATPPESPGDKTVENELNDSHHDSPQQQQPIQQPRMNTCTGARSHRARVSPKINNPKRNDVDVIDAENLETTLSELSGKPDSEFDDQGNLVLNNSDIVSTSDLLTLGAGTAASDSEASMKYLWRYITCDLLAPVSTFALLHDDSTILSFDTEDCLTMATSNAHSKVGNADGVLLERGNSGVGLERGNSDDSKIGTSINTDKTSLMTKNLTSSMVVREEDRL